MYQLALLLGFCVGFITGQEKKEVYALSGNSIEMWCPLTSIDARLTWDKFSENSLLYIISIGPTVNPDYNNQYDLQRDNSNIHNFSLIINNVTKGQTDGLFGCVSGVQTALLEVHVVAHGATSGSELRLWCPITSVTTRLDWSKYSDKDGQLYIISQGTTMNPDYTHLYGLQQNSINTYNVSLIIKIVTRWITDGGYRCSTGAHSEPVDVYVLANEVHNMKRTTHRDWMNSN